jgi:hypothetical protein
VIGSGAEDSLNRDFFFARTAMTKSDPTAITLLLDTYYNVSFEVTQGFPREKF